MKKKILYFSLYSGAVLGFLLSLITFFFYYYDSCQLIPQLNSYYLCFYVTTLIFPILICYLFFSKQKEFLFRELFSVIFLILSTSILIHTLFTWFLYNLIEPNLIIQYADYMVVQISSAQIESLDLDYVYNNLLS